MMWMDIPEEGFGVDRYRPYSRRLNNIKSVCEYDKKITHSP